MKYEYRPSSVVCPSLIEFEVRDHKIYQIRFHGGCPGNTKMVAKLLDGWNIDQVIQYCKGNLCGHRGTSCADQLAVAIETLVFSETTTN